MKIILVGLGVIGGSFAMALKKAGHEDIYGIDTNNATLQKAKDLKIIKQGFTTGEEILGKADLIILSIYPNEVKPFIEKYRSYFKEGAILTDTTGIKGAFIKEIICLLDGLKVDFVFGHPMAGREKKGIDYATERVLMGANYLLVPTEKNNPKNLDFIETLIYKIGFGKVKRVSVKFHDEIIAFTSQLPHVMAVALVNSDEEGKDTGSYIGDSYRELTRIANMNEELWSELFLGNKENLLHVINNFENELSKIKKAIYEEDKATLMSYFIKSTERRERLHKKHFIF
jgi:prephenate dehydrogenase